MFLWERVNILWISITINVIIWTLWDICPCKYAVRILRKKETLFTLKLSYLRIARFFMLQLWFQTMIDYFPFLNARYVSDPLASTTSLRTSTPAGSIPIWSIASLYKTISDLYQSTCFTITRLHKISKTVNANFFSAMKITNLSIR